MQDGVFTRFWRKEGLPSALVFSLAFDKQGALWIGTNGGGLPRYADGEFRTYGAGDGLGGDIAWSILEDAGGSLWVGTYAGGLARPGGERAPPPTPRPGLHTDPVRR